MPKMIGLGMHEAKDAKDVWCPKCKRLWATVDSQGIGQPQQTVYYDSPEDPSEKPWEHECPPCRPDVPTLRPRTGWWWSLNPYCPTCKQYWELGEEILTNEGRKTEAVKDDHGKYILVCDSCFNKDKGWDQCLSKR